MHEKLTILKAKHHRTVERLRAFKAQRLTALKKAVDEILKETKE